MAWEVLYEVVSGSTDLLPEIQSLWEGLRDHHAGISPYFSEEMSVRPYIERLNDFLCLANKGLLKVDVIRHRYTATPVAYCVSSIVETTGEIQSIFVDESLRHQGIATYLMQNALAWMDEHQVSHREIKVMYGNDEVFKFHRQFIFYPRLTTLVAKLP